LQQPHFPPRAAFGLDYIYSPRRLKSVAPITCRRLEIRSRPRLLRLFVLLAAIFALLCSAQHLQAAQVSAELDFDFALIGDTPYDEQQVTNLFPNMIAEINAAKLAFVVHDGDIKSGSTPCTDELFAERLRDFQSFRHPLIYIFGDNEWSDCGKVLTNKFEPEERLEKLRALFTQGSESLGQRKLTLTRQSEAGRFASFRENVRWIYGNVVFAGLNVPGDDNHFGTKEFDERNAANLAWMKEAFAVARERDARAVMLIIQANPQFEISSTNLLRRGFNALLRMLDEQTVAFGKPVVLVHGDSHYFRIDKPLVSSKTGRRLENFTRVETFGNPDVHWLRVSVEERDPNVFTFRPMMVRKNFVRPRK
jgi:hypothetical protein